MDGNKKLSCYSFLHEEDNDKQSVWVFQSYLLWESVSESADIAKTL